MGLYDELLDDDNNIELAIELSLKSKNEDLIKGKYYNETDHMKIAIKESSSVVLQNIDAKLTNVSLQTSTSVASSNVDIRNELKRRHELRYNQEQVFNNFEKRREEINRNEHNQDRKINNNKKLINGHII